MMLVKEKEGSLMYQIINKETFPKRKQYQWFSSFANPCYGFTVKMDVTSLLKHSKATHTSFFINTLYLITLGLNSVEEMRMREVNNEIRLYDTINPTFTVMTNFGVYENCGFKMQEDYLSFYKVASSVIEEAKLQDGVKETFNNNPDFDDYYITCIPWLSIEAMTHPLPDHSVESSSCPRVCWDKYRDENGQIVMMLNITVNHAFVDGKPLSQAFLNIQQNFDNVAHLCC